MVFPTRPGPPPGPEAANAFEGVGHPRASSYARASYVCARVREETRARRAWLTPWPPRGNGRAACYDVAADGGITVVITQLPLPLGRS